MEGESHCNEWVTAADDDTLIPTMGPGPPRLPESVPRDDDAVDEVKRGVHEGNAQRRVGRDGGDVGEGIARRRGGGGGRRGREDDDDVPPPKVCWVPFSYVLIGKCRRHARGGLSMPLADAEGLLLI